MMLVLSVVFGILFPSGDYPNFHVFVLVAILPWNWFNASVAGGLTSIVNNAPLINKVYFPREVLPISMVVSELVNLLFALPVLLGIVLYAGIPITLYVLWVPVIVLIQFAFTLGFVFILATANVYYRDTGLIMDVVLLAWFFLSPIFYPAVFYDNHSFEILGQTLSGSRVAFIVNPIASLISSYRVVLYGSVEGGPPGPPDLLFLGRTAFTAVLMLVIGYTWFLRHSGRFGEEV
jgi:ABC-type polysaccharide/polyol phosphate export permease